MCRVLAVRTFSSSAILLLLDEKGLADKAQDLNAASEKCITGLSVEYTGIH
jgi:hypothetical protein